ncbi:MAG: hypothetical protein K6U09_11315 [Acidobacteriia bacterium]|nr:hypothetical protein [Terriglobia bacterium]
MPNTFITRSIEESGFTSHTKHFTRFFLRQMPTLGVRSPWAWFSGLQHLTMRP